MLLTSIRFLSFFHPFIFAYTVRPAVTLFNRLQTFKVGYNVKLASHVNQSLVVLVHPNLLLLLSTFYRLSSFYLGSTLLDISVCDRKSGFNRFIATYIFGSYTYTTRLFVRVPADNLFFLSSIGHVFNSAVWLEREVYDMFGIFYYGNEDLRRILTDYGFNGFPLQKDFPLVGFVEKQFSLADNTIISRPVSFVQEFRFTDD